MGCQAGDSWRPGEVPGRGGGLPELLARFEHGGEWDSAVPSAALAAALESAACQRAGTRVRRRVR